MKARSVTWLVLLSGISCGVTRALGEGHDGSSGSGGAPLPSAGRGAGSSPTGVASGGVQGVPVLGGEAGDFAVRPPTGEGGVPSTRGGEGGAPSAPSASIGDGGETEPCGPLDVEFIEPSELDPSSWVSEERCDSEAEVVLQAFATYNVDPDADLTPLAGTWTDGSGSARIELTIAEVGTGTVKFGDVPLPAFDAEAAYLSGVGERDVAYRSGEGFVAPLVRGFPYTLVSGGWVGGGDRELVFTFSRTEPWEDWCAAQTPFRGADCYSCVPVGSRSARRDQTCGELQGCFTFEELARQVRVDCGRAALCNHGVCWCSRDGCRSDPTEIDSYSVTVDPSDPELLRLNRSPLDDVSRYLRRE